MGFFDFMDKDNDGAVIDDVNKLAVQVMGATVAAGGAATTAAAPLTGPFAPLVAGAGALTAGAGLGITTYGADLAEEYGDFVSDLGGTRGPVPYATPCTDPHYATRRTDGIGQQLNRWLTSP